MEEEAIYLNAKDNSVLDYYFNYDNDDNGEQIDIRIFVNAHRDYCKGVLGERDYYQILKDSLLALDSQGVKIYRMDYDDNDTELLSHYQLELIKY